MNADFKIFISAAFVHKKTLYSQISRNYFIEDLLAYVSISLQAQTVSSLLKNQWCFGVKC